jgi:hypothetical protein
LEKEILAMRLLRVLGLAGLLGLAVPGFAEEKAAKVEEGKAAPAFDLPAVNIDKALPDKKDAKTLSLNDVKGKNVVLFFYPKALTGG